MDIINKYQKYIDPVYTVLLSVQSILYSRFVRTCVRVVLIEDLGARDGELNAELYGRYGACRKLLILYATVTDI